MLGILYPARRRLFLFIEQLHYRKWDYCNSRIQVPLAQSSAIEGRRIHYDFSSNLLYNFLQKPIRFCLFCRNHCWFPHPRVFGNTYTL